MSQTDPSFSCVTWNIHRCLGNDGKVDPARTMSTLGGAVWQPDFDALILTEADACGHPYRGLLDIGAVEAATGLKSVHTNADLRWSDESNGFLGNIIFVHPSFQITNACILHLPGWAQRGAVAVDLTKDGHMFRLIGAHLSLSQPLRWAQMRVIAQYIERGADIPSVLAGDLNEWRPWGGLALSRKTLGVAFRGPARATFPINRPLLPLDRVLTTGTAKVTSAEALDGPAIRATSDHRPLAARIKFET